MQNHKQPKSDLILDIIEKKGILRTSDLDAYGIQRTYLDRLYRSGKIYKIARGLYTIKNRDISAHHSLAEVSKKVPHGVICLLSALHFHDLTTQLPFEVWIAIANKARKPVSDTLALRVVRFSDKSLHTGIEVHDIEGVKVRIYNPAKTVVDCFKFRNKIGMDVAIEALRDCWKRKLCTMDQLWEYALICRVSNVMRPYLESLV